MSLWDHICYKGKIWNILDDIDYDPKKSKIFLKKHFGWQDYGTKHYENKYTKFNQGLRYFKFDIDMRGVELDHDYDLDKPPYSYEEFLELGREICEKLELDLDYILNMKHGNWRNYRSYRKYILLIKKILGIK